MKLVIQELNDAVMDPLGVKAHDVRAFAASKVFCGGVSTDQILQACHWKFYNTFTSFYLKDLSGQNQKELSSHLGSFVAPQQVMAPPQQPIVIYKRGRGHMTKLVADGVSRNPNHIVWLYITQGKLFDLLKNNYFCC